MKRGVEIVEDQAYFSGSEAELKLALASGRLDRCGSLVIEGKLPSLPAELGRLTRLRELVVETDTLATIDPGLFACAALGRLVVRSNQLKALPTGGWRRLAALERLDLRGSHALRCLPDDLGDAPRLGGEFDLRAHVKLTELPASFTRLTRVTVLHLPPGVPAPDPIAGLSALHTLELHAVDVLPADIGALRGLERLRLQDTTITRLPDSLLDAPAGLRVVLSAGHRVAIEDASAAVIAALGPRVAFG